MPVESAKRTPLDLSKTARKSRHAHKSRACTHMRRDRCGGLNSERLTARRSPPQALGRRCDVWCSKVWRYGCMTWRRGRNTSRDRAASLESQRSSRTRTQRTPFIRSPGELAPHRLALRRVRRISERPDASGDRQRRARETEEAVQTRGDGGLMPRVHRRDRSGGFSPSAVARSI